MPLLQPILVTRRLPDAVEAILRRDYGATLNATDAPLDAPALRRALATYPLVLCTLTDRITADVLREALGEPAGGADGATRAQGVRLLANFGAGTNHIDLQATRAHGIVVTNTPGVLTDDTADLTMLLILAVARRAREGSEEIRTASWTGWRPTHLLGTRATGATLGIVGFGRIGQAVARRAAHGFGMRVLYHSRRRVDPAVESASGASFRPTLTALLSESDVVSLHCPATPDTHHLIGADELGAMQRHALLVNTARGDVVDEGALLAALEAGTIGGAGLDVFEHEPRVPHVLQTHPAVFALPHLGSATIASRVAMGECAVRNIVAYLDGAAPPNRVA